MKASGEAKPGSGHGISWFYKQSLPAEHVHTLTKAASGRCLCQSMHMDKSTRSGHEKLYSLGRKCQGHVEWC
jgi:hypothetical protein